MAYKVNSKEDFRMEKLKGKDLINVGIYSAIYFVIMMIVAMLGVVPVLYPTLVVFVPLIGGIPFMLFLTKVKKFGMIWIMSILMGILMVVCGMGYYALIVGVVTGLLAEFVFKSGKYNNTGKAILTCGVFGLWVWGNYLQLFIDREAFFSSPTRQGLGEDFINTINTLLPAWMCPVMLVICLVCGILGGLLGKKLLKKHFSKAGIV